MRRRRGRGPGSRALGARRRPPRAPPRQAPGVAAGSGQDLLPVGRCGLRLPSRRAGGCAPAGLHAAGIAFRYMARHTRRPSPGPRRMSTHRDRPVQGARSEIPSLWSRLLPGPWLLLPHPHGLGVLAHCRASVCSLPQPYSPHREESTHGPWDTGATRVWARCRFRPPQGERWGRAEVRWTSPRHQARGVSSSGGGEAVRTWTNSKGCRQGALRSAIGTRRASGGWSGRCILASGTTGWLGAVGGVGQDRRSGDVGGAHREPTPAARRECPGRGTVTGRPATPRAAPASRRNWARAPAPPRTRIGPGGPRAPRCSGKPSSGRPRGALGPVRPRCSAPAAAPGAEPGILLPAVGAEVGGVAIDEARRGHCAARQRRALAGVVDRARGCGRVTELLVGNRGPTMPAENGWWNG